jgi:hypothetical protein
MPQPVYPQEKIPGTHWIGGWVDPRTGLDNVEKRKFLTLLEQELNPSAIQPIASHYTNYFGPALHSVSQETFFHSSWCINKSSKMVLLYFNYQGYGKSV